MWTLLHDVGLEHYYALRDRIGEDGERRGRADRADAPAEFGYLDDPSIQATMSDGRPDRAELHLVGLHCPACVWLIERLPEVLAGVRLARVAQGRPDRGGGPRPARLIVEWDPQRVALSEIAAFLHRAGYEVHASDAAGRRAEHRERRRDLVRIAVAGASAGNVMLISIALYAGGLQDMDVGWTRFFESAALILALPALTWAAMPFYRAAWTGIRMGRLHIDLPISLGLLGGFGASVVATIVGDPSDHREVYFDSISMLVFLLLVGRWIQRRGQEWALSRTDLLQRLLPARARRLVQDDRLETVAATALAAGDRIAVAVGECIAADGRILTGTSSVDASTLTGESLPLAVEVGDTVLAGTRNLDGNLTVLVEAAGDATRIGSLAARIMQADRERAPIQRSVDVLSGWFVAAVLVLAVLGGLAWWSIAPQRAFGVVVSLLVVSCPCALGLATPVALAVARGRAADQGILFASAGAIEALARARTAVFDKTGTLTHGELRVVDLALAENVERRDVVALVGAIERDSGHPIGQALRRWAGAESSSDALQSPVVEDQLGQGRSAEVDGTSVRIGSLAWIGGVDPSFASVIEPALGRGETAVLVERSGIVVAALTLADSARSDASVALDRLRALGLHVALRSGDHPRTVSALANRLGIRDYVGGCSPERKATELAQLPAAAMIGDGVNDAPAMRAASVGVAVRGGAEVALRVADVHLSRPGVGEVAALFEGSRRTMRVIHRNLMVSLAYNLVFASLALAGRIDPLVAALLMPASSVTVVLSSVVSHTFMAPANLARQSLRRLSSVRPARSI